MGGKLNKLKAHPYLIPAAPPAAAPPAAGDEEQEVLLHRGLGVAPLEQPKAADQHANMKKRKAHGVKAELYTRAGWKGSAHKVKINLNKNLVIGSRVTLVLSYPDRLDEKQTKSKDLKYQGPQPGEMIGLFLESAMERLELGGTSGSLVDAETMSKVRDAAVMILNPMKYDGKLRDHGLLYTCKEARGETRRRSTAGGNSKFRFGSKRTNVTPSTADAIVSCTSPRMAPESTRKTGVS
eukprot:SAG11_NODE_2088_length_3844_cov_1.785905_3_plen_238_part_00